MNSKKVVEEYLGRSDWRVRENSNAPFCYGGLNKYIVGEVSKDYWLREVYPERVAKEYLDGKMHIHDLGGLSLYCCGYSLRAVISMGVQGVPNIPTSAPARHFDSILNQLANLVTILQNEVMGAIAFSSFDTLLAPFVKKDGLTYEQVRQNMQNFIYSINSNSRQGAEPAFSNLTFDLTPPSDLIDDYANVGGELQEFTYRDCQAEMDMINRAFFELMNKGDARGRGFAYPIPTYNIHERFDWDNKNSSGLWGMAGKFGYPYFANFINSDMDVSDARSMCPMDENTLLVVRDKDDCSTQTLTIATMYEEYESSGKVYQVQTNYGWTDAIPNRTEATDTVLVTFRNDTSVVFGVNHLQPTRHFGTIFAGDLQSGMLIPFLRPNSKEYDYIAIRSVEKAAYTGKYLYCVELSDEHKLFALANGLVTHNCRLRLDLTELRRRNGGLFGSGDSTGSIGVCTINLPLIAYENKGDKKAFYAELDRVLGIAKDSLEIKRKWLQENCIDNHLIPAFITYVGSLRNHFSTIGVVGMSEMCENFFGEGHDILSDEGKTFAIEVGTHIRNKLIEFQQETGSLYNFEATPAESTAYRLASKDKKKYPDIITRGTEQAPYYTNSCHIPVSKIKGIKNTFEHQEDLQILFTGGTVIHIFMNSSIPADTAKSIVKTVCESYRVPYISISPLNRYCPDHGYISDPTDRCPICGKSVEMYQRVTGYLRPVANFNDGKLAEFNERVQLNTDINGEQI